MPQADSVSTTKPGRRNFLVGAVAAVAVGAAAFPANAQPTSALAQLTDEFNRGWQRETDLFSRLSCRVDDPLISEVEASLKHMTKVLLNIDSYHATTLEGLRLKARAISYCHSGDEIDFGDDLGTDMRLALSIIHDLLNLPSI